jgi:hypothetical protein
MAIKEDRAENSKSGCYAAHNQKSFVADYQVRQRRDYEAAACHGKAWRCSPHDSPRRRPESRAQASQESKAAQNGHPSRRFKLCDNCANGIHLAAADFALACVLAVVPKNRVSRKPKAIASHCDK